MFGDIGGSLVDYNDTQEATLTSSRIRWSVKNRPDSKGLRPSITVTVNADIRP